MREATLNWYHHYLNHPGGDRLANTIKQSCYWNGLSNQAKKLVKTCKICQQHKRKRKYRHVPAKTIEDLMPWRTVHTDLIGPYSITAKQTQPGGEIKEVDLQLTAMTMVDPATGWFEIVEFRITRSTTLLTIKIIILTRVQLELVNYLTKVG